VACSSAGGVWRLASDEGAYLNGLDEAPCPLAFMTAGIVASFMDAVRAGLACGGVGHRHVRLVQDNYYTMQGSMPRRTMVGGARPVELEIEIETDCEANELRPLVVKAVEAAPVAQAAGSLPDRPGHALRPGHADPVKTHVYLETSEDDTFALEVLDIGERTCFLHALCRTAVPVNVRVTTRAFVSEHV
jgi:hypothetical protein